MITKEAKEIARLSQTETFIEEFQKHMPGAETNAEAYEKVEARYKSLFGCTKYANYKSFERVYYRYLKKRKQQRHEEIKRYRETF